MNYTGDYANNTVYGTANRNKIKVTKTALENATHIVCTISVTVIGKVWTHKFTAPFFNNEAELYIENYVHSILTEVTDITAVSTTDINLFETPFASVYLGVAVMNNSTVVTSYDRYPSMLMGTIDTVSLDDFDEGYKKALDTFLPLFVTKNAVLTFSYLSQNHPVSLLIQDGITDTSITLPEDLSEFPLIKYMTVPVSALPASTSNNIKFTLVFADDSTLYVGETNYIDDGVDHNILFFQNGYGCLSSIEFTGAFANTASYKRDSSVYGVDGDFSYKGANISTLQDFSCNTGYYMDANKYKLLGAALKSYNLFMLEDGEFLPIEPDGSHKFTPYSTDDYSRSETIKFKASENDDIHYRNF